MELIHAAFDEHWPDLPIEGEAIDYLRWKIRCPLLDSTDSLVIEKDGRFVALSTSVARHAILRGRKYFISAGGGDTCVHPDYQGQGLYRALNIRSTELSRQHAAFAVGNSTNATVIRSRESRGVHSIVHPFDRMLKPLAARPASATPAAVTSAASPANSASEAASSAPVSAPDPIAPRSRSPPTRSTATTSAWTPSATPPLPSSTSSSPATPAS